DAEPRYLVSVRPARISNNKKSCSGRNKTQKPLQLVVGTLTPTSVFLSWGILVNPQHDWTATSNCASDSRFYTVRYREKDKDKKWVFQLCPVTETVVDNLKPNTVYEFGVKDNVEDSIWSKTSNHKTVVSSKYLATVKQIAIQFDSIFSSLTLRDNKKLIPVTIIKQVIQNRTQSKTADSSSLPGAILVHLIVPGLNETQQKLPPLPPIDDRPQASRKKLAKNETRVWPAESKTSEVQEISPQSLPGN
ncbi:TARSH protein, partial [Columbina picui]|nr:TARSH protein [Columbina picui]